MGKIDDITKMQKEGQTDDQIKSYLKSQGYADKDASLLISQAKIKTAIGSDDNQNMTEQVDSDTGNDSQAMQPSLINQQNNNPQDYQNQDYSQQAQQVPNPQYQDYQNYQQPQALNSDVITEIAEQIVSEKMNSVRDKLEKATDMKNIFETRITYLEERVKRIEKIIDRLQLSVLQKVGDYMSNIEDIKKEMIETQNSFKASASRRTKEE